MRSEESRLRMRSDVMCAFVLGWRWAVKIGGGEANSGARLRGLDRPPRAEDQMDIRHTS